MKHLLLGVVWLMVLGCAATPASTRPPPATWDTPSVATPCSPEAIARDMRLLGAFFFWTREGARNRLGACQGQPLTATPVAPQPPTYHCYDVYNGLGLRHRTCRPGL